MTIVLDQVQYVPHSASARTDTARDVQYLGVLPRKSDGIHCLSFRRPSSLKANNDELSDVLSIEIGARRWRRPDTYSFTWRERAAELRLFIEQIKFTEADFN